MNVFLSVEIRKNDMKGFQCLSKISDLQNSSNMHSEERNGCAFRDFLLVLFLTNLDVEGLD